MSENSTSVCRRGGCGPPDKVMAWLRDREYGGRAFNDRSDIIELVNTCSAYGYQDLVEGLLDTKMQQLESQSLQSESLANELGVGSTFYSEELLLSDAMLSASKNGYVDTVLALLARDADSKLVNWIDDDCGRTPLMLAAGNGRYEVVRILVANGAELDYRDRDGRTALMYASQYTGDDDDGMFKDLEIVRFLVASGADIHACDHDGQTALCYAAKGDSPEVVQFLEEQFLVEDLMD